MKEQKDIPITLDMTLRELLNLFKDRIYPLRDEKIVNICEMAELMKSYNLEYFLVSDILEDQNN